MRKTILLLKYNKVHNESIKIIEKTLSEHFDIIVRELKCKNETKDFLTLNQIKKSFEDLTSFHAIVYGDVFWPTGQSLCEWCNNNSIPLFFLQHGQWIYIKNKQELKHYPMYTLLFGDDVKNMCLSWKYGSNSSLNTTGSPRYDGITKEELSNDYVLFFPPVVEEILHGLPSGIQKIHSIKLITKVTAGIDNETNLVIQPHYREAKIKWLKEIFPKAQFVSEKDNTIELIKKAKKVITCRNSTTVLDSIACYKPIVLIDIGLHDVSIFKRGYFKEFATESESKEHFFKTVLDESVVNFDNYEQRARKYIYLGNSSQRIVKLIQEVLERI